MNYLQLRKDFENILQSYQASEASQQVLKQSKIALFDGPSASGRNTITVELVKTGRYHQIVSDTTRLPRTNNGITEQDGVEYWFKTEREFLEGLEKGLYIEAAIIHNQQVSGVSVAEVERAHASGKIAITDIQSDGVESFLRYNADPACFFIVPPSLTVWLSRLQARGALGEDERRRRLQSAASEIEHALQNDYYHIVVNDDLQLAVQTIDAFCQKQLPTSEGDRAVAETLLGDIRKIL
ncbi:MAG: hypothetical protein U0520_02190 [Candidatus Saccharimonadales bacterium]